jgi:hypothetical protein
MGSCLQVDRRFDGAIESMIWGVGAESDDDPTSDARAMLHTAATDKGIEISGPANRSNTEVMAPIESVTIELSGHHIADSFFAAAFGLASCAPGSEAPRY